MKLIDLTGQRFGRLLVLCKGEPRKNGGSNWHCICDCGANVVAIGSHLRRGVVRSCGCLAREWSSHMGSDPEFVSRRSETITKHGHKSGRKPTVEYRTWLGMKRRCSDTKSKDYPNWGGRGIKVCTRWNESFEAFLSDMGLRPSDKHSIDRIDSNGNYEPSNCRWATLAEQGSENRRGLVSVCIDGKHYSSLKEACNAYGMPYTTVFDRIKRGISVEVAIKTPVRKLPNQRTRDSYLRKALRNQN